MSILKRGKHYYLRVRPFGELINVKTSAQSKSAARDIERAVLTACRAGDFRSLTPDARAVCVRMFQNQNWALPEDLVPQDVVREELTLWKAIEVFLNYPGIKDSPSKERYLYALAHVVKKWGREKPIKAIWVPQLKEYQIDRLNDGAAPATINKEKAALSRLFQVLVELQHVQVNPVRLLKPLSEKNGERQVYLSFGDVRTIMAQCPAWFRPMILTAYYTGMRRGEILGLARKQVNLSKRIITLSPEDTKEAHWKRVPIHSELAPVMEGRLKVTSIGTDKVFLWQDKKNVRPLELETFKNPWPRACEKLQNKDPENPYFKGALPHFHDLRHTWRTNARRSGMDPQIAENILGHWCKGKSVNDRYGRISDQELVQAIDNMTFDHGETEIWVARDTSVRDQNVIKRPEKKKRSCGNMT
jgi:integrase